MIWFTVYGNPIGKARPRFIRATGFCYTPKTTRQWEESIIGQALKHRPKELITRPIALRMDFYLMKPKSVTKKRQYPCVAPDCDNLAKSVLDALNGVMFLDDKLVVDMRIRKLYDRTPRVEIIIVEL